MAGQRPIEIPHGCYDVGDGYFNPKGGNIFSYDVSLCVELRWLCLNACGCRASL